MADQKSVRVQLNSAFDKSFRSYISKNPMNGAKLLARIEDFAATGSGNIKLIESLDGTNLVEMRIDGVRVIMLIDKEKDEVHLIELVLKQDTKIDTIKNLSAISMLSSVFSR